MSYLASLLASLATLWATTFGGHPDPHDPKLDLLVNGQDNPKHIVQIEDLKPGDDWYVDKDLLVKYQDATVYLHLTDLKSSPGRRTEPEKQEEAALGHPKSDLQNYLTYDLKIANQVLINFTDGVLFPNVFSCWIPLGPLAKDTHLTLTQSFHFDPTVTNWAQGDKLTFTEEFLALPASSGTDPRTDSGRVWDPGLRRCIPGPTPTPKPSPTPKPTSTPRPTNTPRPTRIPH